MLEKTPDMGIRVVPDNPKFQKEADALERLLNWKLEELIDVLVRMGIVDVGSNSFRDAD